MRMHFVTVPVFDGAQAERELNAFLSQHRVLSLDRQFLHDGAASAWAICVTYVDGEAPARTPKKAPGRVDYREVLPDAEFAVFSKLRALRKALAERDGVPPYAVFTNEQLAAMVQRKIQDTTELASLSGVGQARVAKYGQDVLEVVRAWAAEAEAERGSGEGGCCAS